MIPDDSQWNNFDAIEDVIMIGCPRGIFDEANNLPIVRKGTTASALSKRYNGRSKFMVDMACFPGSSGSPVFLNQSNYYDKINNAMVMGMRFFFLGVMYAGPTFTAVGQIALGQQPRIEVAGMMHLGQVIRSSEIVPLENELRKRFT